MIQDYVIFQKVCFCFFFLLFLVIKFVFCLPDKKQFVFSISKENFSVPIVLKNGPEKAAWMADIVTLLHEKQLQRSKIFFFFLLLHYMECNWIRVLNFVSLLMNNWWWCSVRFLYFSVPFPSLLFSISILITMIMWERDKRIEIW